MAEICQLDVEDISKVEGVWCISINDKNGKSLKTSSAKRIIPIHRDLLQLDFVAFAKHQREQGHSKLFPDVKSWRGSHSHYPSKWFEKFRKRIGVDERHVDFHALRHNFSDAARSSGVPEHLAQMLVGDKNSSLTFGHYGAHGNPVKLLNKELDKIKFDVNFNHITSFKEHVTR